MRKRKRDGNSPQIDAEREHLYEENGTSMRHLFRDSDSRNAKCLVERREALYDNSGKRTKGNFHTDSNIRAVMNDAKIGLTRDRNDAIQIQRENFIEGKIIEGKEFIFRSHQPP